MEGAAGFSVEDFDEEDDIADGESDDDGEYESFGADNTDELE